MWPYTNAIASSSLWLKKGSLGLLAIMLILATAASFSETMAPNRVLLTLDYVDKWESGGVISHDVRLVARVVGPGIVRGIRAVRVDESGETVASTDVFMGDLQSGDAYAAPIRIRHPSHAELPEVFFRLEYIDGSGRFHTEMLNM